MFFSNFSPTKDFFNSSENLSIIIVNWNAKEFILHCLENLNSIIKNNLLEVIIVDNRSIDGSGEEIKKLFPNFKLIENKTNLGFAKAVNQGLRLSESKYVLLLNPDTLIREEALIKLKTFMDNHPDVGIAGAQLINEDGSKQNSIANFPSLVTELLNKRLLRWLLPERFPGKERQYHEPIEVDSVIGACMMVRREAIEQVGLMDEDYFLFFEETDLCYRMKRAGWKIYHVPQAQIIHFQGKSAEKEKERAKVEYYRSRYIFFKKNRGISQWLILLIGLMVKLILSFILYGILNLITFFKFQKIKRRFKIYCYLLWWHLKGCPEGMGLK